MLLHAQNKPSLLDTAKLAIFSNDGSTLTQSQIYRADSILINIVNYYNARVDRKHSLVYLSDSDYNEFLKIDSLRNIYSPYLTEKGNVKKHKLSKLDITKKNHIVNLIDNKSTTDSLFKTYIVKGQTRQNDTIVLSYGSMDRIEINKYCRQYSINHLKDGSIHISAFCFCQDILQDLERTKLINWKKTPLKISHGASCVFNVYNIDLTKGLGRMMKVNTLK